MTKTTRSTRILSPAQLRAVTGGDPIVVTTVPTTTKKTAKKKEYDFDGQD